MRIEALSDFVIPTLEHFTALLSVNGDPCAELAQLRKRLEDCQTVPDESCSKLGGLIGQIKQKEKECEAKSGAAESHPVIPATTPASPQTPTTQKPKGRAASSVDDNGDPVIIDQ